MPSPGSDQRRCGYAWRRMFVRRSATRRPHMQFIKIIAIYIDYEDKNLALSGSSASGAEVSVSGRWWIIMDDNNLFVFVIFSWFVLSFQNGRGCKGGYGTNQTSSRWFCLHHMLLSFSQLIIRNIDRLYQYLLQASSNLVDNITYGAAICSLIVTKYFIFSVALDINLNRTFKMFNIQIQICKITSFHYFWVKLSSVCLMFAYRKKSNDL